MSETIKDHYPATQTEAEFNEMFAEPLCFSNESEFLSRLLYPTREEAYAAFLESPDIDSVEPDRIFETWVHWAEVEEGDSIGDFETGEWCWQFCKEGTPGAFPTWTHDVYSDLPYLKGCA